MPPLIVPRVPRAVWGCGFSELPPSLTRTPRILPPSYTARLSIGEPSRGSYSNHRSAHKLSSDMAVCLDVVMRQSARAGEGRQPPGPALLANDFYVPYQIALADDPDNALVSIDHRHAADTPRVHRFRDIAYGCVWCDAHDVSCHNIGCGQHGIPPPCQEHWRVVSSPPAGHRSMPNIRHLARAPDRKSVV